MFAGNVQKKTPVGFLFSHLKIPSFMHCTFMENRILLPFRMIWENEPGVSSLRVLNLKDSTPPSILNPWRSSLSSPFPYRVSWKKSWAEDMQILICHSTWGCSNKEIHCSWQGLHWQTVVLVVTACVWCANCKDNIDDSAKKWFLCSYGHIFALLVYSHCRSFSLHCVSVLSFAISWCSIWRLRKKAEIHSLQKARGSKELQYVSSSLRRQ